MNERMVVEHLNGGVTQCCGNCMKCGESIYIKVKQEDFDDWKRGKLIHRAFPYLNADDREFMISDICGPCFDAIFADDGDIQNDTQNQKN